MPILDKSPSAASMVKQDHFMQKMIHWIRERQLLKSQQKVLVAISGGLDSTVLVHSLHRLHKMFGIQLHMAHIDHGTREMASRQEGRWVEVLAEQLSIPCHRLQINKEVIKNQNSLRMARQKKLEQLAERLGADVIATAHHQSDNVETLLMRLMSGTGVRALRGIVAKRGKWVRPLLNHSRVELEAYAKNYGLAWLEDPSNERDAYFRNKLRHHLLPLMEKLRTGSLQNVARLAERVAQEEEQWKEWIAQSWPGELNKLPLAWFDSWPKVLKRRIIHFWLENLNVELSPSKVEKLCLGKAVFTVEACFLPQGDALCFVPEKDNFGALWQKPSSIDVGKAYDLGRSMAWSFLDKNSQLKHVKLKLFLLFTRPSRPPKDGLNTLINWDKLPWPLQIVKVCDFPNKEKVRELHKILLQRGIPEIYAQNWPLLIGENQAVSLLGVKVFEPFLYSSGKNRVLSLQLMTD